ncbi:MAG TPA: GNAT family N-acetyltransferase [Ktedonobacteraceae bacterium]|nr:GNAT family N-acetyltransferase [Ktedonobacteraceae bacterium]
MEQEILLPPGFTVRHIRMEDLEAVTDLMLACELADYGQNEYGRASMRESIGALWGSEGMDLTRNAWVVLTPEGRCVGRTNLWFSPNEPEEMFASPRVHPAYWGLGIGSFLIRQAEQRARQLMIDLPAGKPVSLNSWIEGVNEQASQLLIHQGFTALRYYWRMELEMAEQPSQPDWPADITVRSMWRDQEEHKVFEAYNDAFQDHWGHNPEDFAEWSYWSFREKTFDPSLWLLALDGTEIAGFALCRLDGSEPARIGIVDDLGVRGAWRKRGLGLALLQHAFGTFYQRGIYKCALSVDSENTSGATRLYERAGMYRSPRVDVRYTKVLQTE